tara:strand:- start:843 stop:1664 length:822 start_codon:yes stop_codon:yes gene_type:complete
MARTNDKVKALKSGYNEVSLNEDGLFIPEHYEAYFMPIVSTHSRFPTLAGFEALARTSGKHALAPSTFINKLKERDHVDLLDLAIIERALKFAQQHPEITMSVNMSPELLSRPDSAECIIEMCHKYRLDNKNIKLEIIEEPFPTEHLNTIIRNLQSLHEAEHPIWIDDFGTQDSNFTRIKMLKNNGINITGIKIDQSLVEDEKLMMIIRENPDLKKYSIIAEGIETDRQYGVVTNLFETPQLQGYGFRKALSPHQAHLEIARQIPGYLNHALP